MCRLSWGPLRQSPRSSSVNQLDEQRSWASLGHESYKRGELIDIRDDTNRYLAEMLLSLRALVVRVADFHPGDPGTVCGRSQRDARVSLTTTNRARIARTPRTCAP